MPHQKQHTFDHREEVRRMARHRRESEDKGNRRRSSNSIRRFLGRLSINVIARIIADAIMRLLS